TDSSMVNVELSDFDNIHNFSSLESLGLDNHQPIADGPIASGYDKLNGGDKGRSRSDKCTEDSRENNEVHSSHSQDIKMKAPLKPTKIVIKKKLPPEDIEGSKLKFGSSKADSIGARSDVISGNPSFTGPDRLTEALEGGDDRNTSSLQLLNSYSDQRCYNHVHERNKSYKREPSPNGFGFDLGKNASTYSNQHGLGIDLSNVVSDPIRRTRSIRMKTTSKEPNALSTRIKIRGGQSSRGVSSLEDSSINAFDELHQRTRSARNRSDEYIASDPGILTQSMPNRHVKKLSWLMLSEAHEEGCRYIPQLGDEVVYLRQ
ncbi:bromodomain and WD repeat-containing protein 3-like, partial [Trifolium medium]|nr:bromodomain and WD repeat-containing protein 3-like [Trifolium medium]